MIQKENLTDKINLSGPPINDLKYTINQVFDLHDPLDTIPLIQKYQNFDPVIRQLKSWHKYKTNSTKADTTILGNKTLL